ncbi:MAG TPA: acyl-CoA dehydrogenase family protein [Candidatus Dormibacteraeota bacterium]|nr:acyl-CoA dehydrogenase family protein [Candidatus Dormibacteraeota bacterium]
MIDSAPLVKLAFTPEQEELRRSLRRFLDEVSPVAEVRRLMDTEEGYDPKVWSRMATELGLQGIHVPEAMGGAGLGQVELAVVFEELGRRLACVPYFSTVGLAVNTLLASGDEAAQAELLPRLASGEATGTLAVLEDAGTWDLDGLGTQARRSGEGWVLDGHKSFVVDGHTADVVLVAARTPAGLAVLAVEGGAAGLERVPVPTLDQTRKLARLELSGTPARLVGEAGGAETWLRRALDLAAVALAAEQVGSAQRCLDMTVAYAKVRQQFGRPIGSFQAIKHRCADMLLRVESARAAAYYAAWAAAEDADELPAVASLARAYCSDACSWVAGETIQVHGGIGFTWEHDAHLYFKRAKASELLLGDPAHHRELMLQRIGI